METVTVWYKTTPVTFCWKVKSKSVCLFCLVCFREGRSNAHIKGDYQRIGDVMLKNLQALKVCCKGVKNILLCNMEIQFSDAQFLPWSESNLFTATGCKPAQAVWCPAGAGEGVQGVSEVGASVQRFRAAEGLLHPPQRLHPAAAAPPHLLQADPGASVQTLPWNTWWLQGLQR